MSIIKDAYRRYSRKRFPLPTEEQVRALEERIQVDLPGDYRAFLMEFNGGYFVEPTVAPTGEEFPEVFLTYLSGIGASHPIAELGEPTLDPFDDNDPLKIMPIGSTPMGDLIILDTAPEDGHGTIYLKQAFGDFYWLASSIADFFKLLRDPPSA